MGYSPSRRDHIPHAFAYGARSVSLSHKDTSRVDRSPPSPPFPPSPISPPSSLEHEDPTSPITPLWAMSSFVTSSTFARSPVSVTSNEMCTPGLGSFDWSPSTGTSHPIQFPIKESIAPSLPPLPSQSPLFAGVSTTFASAQYPVDKRSRASTDLDRPLPSVPKRDSRVRKSSKASSQSLDITNGGASVTDLHRRSKSHSGKRTHCSTSSAGSEVLFPRRPSTSASSTSIGTVTTTQDELMSMADAAEMALRRRSRSHLDSLSSFHRASSSLSSSCSAIDIHRRSASLGGSRLDFALQSLPSTSPTRRLRQGSQASRTGVPLPPIPGDNEPPLVPLQPIPVRPQTSKRATLRSPPLPPTLTATPPPLPLTARPPPPTRAPPPIPRPSPVKSKSLPVTTTITTTTPTRTTVQDTAEEMHREAVSAIREAECWDWPVPPPLAGRRHLLALTRVHPISAPKSYSPSPRIGSMDFGVTTFDCLTLSSEPSKLLGFPWQSNAGIESRRSSSSDQVPPRTNSSVLSSSEHGPLTPDDIHFDPFDRLTSTASPLSASVGHSHSNKDLPSLPLQSPTAPAFTRPKYKSTLSSTRFVGVPF